MRASGNVYTIMRPGWFQDRPAGKYTLTRKGQPFQGHDISLDSLSELIADLVTARGLHVHESIGVSGR